MNLFTSMATIGTMALGSIAFTAIAADQIVVNLETAGALGVEILYQADKLSDVTHLKVNGPLNSDDWVTIKNLTSIVDLALSGAFSTSMPEDIFRDRGSLKTITLPSNLASIPKNAFRGSGITEITLPASVRIIESYSFYHTTSLQTFSVEENSELTNISEYAFRESALSSITFSKRLQTIGEYAFYNCSGLESVILPESLNSIGNSAFYSCTNLKTINFPENVTSIGSSAFCNTSLIEVILPANATVRSEAFSFNQSLTSIQLPAKMTVIPDYLCRECTSLKDVYVPAVVPPEMNYAPFAYTPISSATLHVPEVASVYYKLDPNWLGFGNITGDFSANEYIFKGEAIFANGRRPEGTPSFALVDGGRMSVSGTSPMTVNQLTIYNSLYSPYFYGQVINSSPLMTANKVEASFDVYYNTWYFLTLPYDIKVADIHADNATAAFVVRYYDGTQRAQSGTGASWKDYATDATIPAGTGFIFQTNSHTRFYFPATNESHARFFTPNAVNMSLEANESENPANSGWNFIGNPFPSYYDLYYTMLTCPVTVWNNNYSRYDAYSLIDDNVVLNPYQPFFVQADADLNSVEFGTKGRQYSNVISRQSRLRTPSTTTRSLFNLTLANANGEDNTRVVLNEMASENYEPGCDATKFFGDNEAIPSVYTIDANGNRLAINERPADTDPVRLGFYAPEAGIFSLTASRTDGILIVNDNLTGESHELYAGDTYKFEVTAPGTIDNRLSLSLTGNVGTGVKAAVDSKPAISIDGHNVSVASASTVAVYSIDGRIIAHQSFGENGGNFTLASGAYIIVANGNAVKCIIK